MQLPDFEEFLATLSKDEISSNLTDVVPPTATEEERASIEALQFVFDYSNEKFIAVLNLYHSWLCEKLNGEI